MIIMSGWKIYPTEVENVIIQHPAVDDVAVFGVQDERKGEVPVAAVVPAPGKTITIEESALTARPALRHTSARAGSSSVESLPQTDGWKLLRRSLRESTV